MGDNEVFEGSEWQRLRTWAKCGRVWNLRPIMQPLSYVDRFL